MTEEPSIKARTARQYNAIRQQLGDGKIVLPAAVRIGEAHPRYQELLGVLAELHRAASVLQQSTNIESVKIITNDSAGKAAAIPLPDTFDELKQLLSGVNKPFAIKITVEEDKRPEFREVSNNVLHDLNHVRGLIFVMQKRPDLILPKIPEVLSTPDAPVPQKLAVAVKSPAPFTPPPEKLTEFPPPPPNANQGQLLEYFIKRYAQAHALQETWMPLGKLNYGVVAKHINGVKMRKGISEIGHERLRDFVRNKVVIGEWGDPFARLAGGLEINDDEVTELRWQAGVLQRAHAPKVDAEPSAVATIAGESFPALSAAPPAVETQAAAPTHVVEEVATPRAERSPRPEWRNGTNPSSNGTHTSKVDAAQWNHLPNMGAINLQGKKSILLYAFTDTVDLFRPDRISERAAHFLPEKRQEGWESKAIELHKKIELALNQFKKEDSIQVETLMTPLREMYAWLDPRDEVGKRGRDIIQQTLTALDVPMSALEPRGAKAERV